MPPLAVAQQLQCSARLVRPFLEVLRGSEPDGAARYLRVLGLKTFDGEVSVQRAYRLLCDAISRTQDEGLGLKAGARMDAGDTGVFDYLLLTSATVGEALAIATRYILLLNEALSCAVKTNDVSVEVRFEFRLKPPAAVEDFLLSSWFGVHGWLRKLSRLECRFQHTAPAELQEYRDAFGDAQLRFDADSTAFVFPRAQLDLPLASAEPKLHEILRELGDVLLARRVHLVSFADRVRAVVAQELTTRPLNAAFVASRLQTSARTLARRLEAEGTSFYSIVDESRRARALELIHEPLRTLDEIAQSTGFAHGESFHRAFRRWTGKTPTEYRNHAAAAVGLTDASSGAG